MRYHISSSTKAYIRFKGDVPETQLTASAYEGFSKLGAECVPFYWSDEIEHMEDLGPETLICGYIGDVHAGLKKLGKPIPPTLDYPDSLKPFFGREIVQCRLGDIRRSVLDDSKSVFIKPVEHKAFTGFVYDGGPVSRRRVVLHDDDTPIYKADVIPMVAEFRCVVLDGEILDVRRYKGDWACAPHRDDVEAAVAAFQASGEAPICYTLDVAFVPIDGGFHGANTVVVEVNDGFAFGHYGMYPEAYATCLAARWREMVA